MNKRNWPDWTYRGIFYHLFHRPYRATGFLFIPGDDGLLPFERARMARKWERDMGLRPQRKKLPID